MPARSSLKEPLARPVPGPADDRSVSSSSISVVLHRIRPMSEPVSVAQMLTRHGIGLRKAHQALNRLAADEWVPLHLPANADVGGLLRELAELGVELLRPLVPGSVDVRGLCKSLGLTQLGFATRFGLDLDAVPNWEQAAPAQTTMRGSCWGHRDGASTVEDALAGIAAENLAASFDDAPIGREAL